MNLFPLKKSSTDVSRSKPFDMGFLDWSPFDEFGVIHDRINQILGRLYGEGQTETTSYWRPAMDVRETDKELQLKMDVPGMEKKDITVELEENQLVIHGERKHEEETKKEGYFHTERAWGSFYRRLPLPDYVDKEHIKASCKDGVLSVSLAKVPGKKKEAKTISVE